MEVGHLNVVQIVTDDAHVGKAAGLIIEAEFPSIYWTPCVVHTLNLALKNICAAKNTKKIMRFMKNVVGSHILPTMPCMLEILSWVIL